MYKLLERLIKPFLSLGNLVTLYRSIVEPYFSYCCIVWDGIGETIFEPSKTSKSAARILTSSLYSKPSAEIRSELGWISFAEIRHQHKAIMMCKVVDGLCPYYRSDMFTLHKALNDYSIRSSNTDLVLPKIRTNYYKNSFVFLGVKVWNALPCSLKQETSLDRFKAKIKSFTICTGKA